MRWYNMMASMGALILAACGTPSDGSATDCAGGCSNVPPGGYDEQQVDLTGGYATCEEALAALGYIVWTDYVEYQDAAAFYVYFTDDDDGDIRPWVATMSFDDSELGYHVTCGDTQNSPVKMWVDPEQEDYWSCLFQYDKIGLLNPDSDSGCSVRITDGDRILNKDAEIEDFVLRGPGHLVLDEE